MVSAGLRKGTTPKFMLVGCFSFSVIGLMLDGFRTGMAVFLFL